MAKLINWSHAIRWGLIIYALSQLFFLIQIQFPRSQNFDEFHYVPSAKQHLANQKNQNWEHPPLGKELMAIGIAVAGDQPAGWRVMSTLFGALTLVGMFIWALVLFRNESWALWVTALTLVNHLLYVQARIGMLDTFMLGFLVWAFAGISAVWLLDLTRRTRLLVLYSAGALLGFAMACKWAAVVPWLLVIGITGLFQFYPAQKSRSWLHLAAALIGVPLLTYAIPFIPLFWVPETPATFAEFIAMQVRMYEGQLRVVTSHPYMSQWYDWAILRRPIWYAFDKEPGGTVRGVLLVGNPAVMWGGLVAIAFVVWDWLRSPSKVAFIIGTLYFGMYFCWWIIPRKISFYYYYYPSGMILSLALAYFFARTENTWFKKLPYVSHGFLGLSLGIFAHFFPILAGLKISENSFSKWMWFTSWI